MPDKSPVRAGIALATWISLAAVANSMAADRLPLGELVHDGPATPEQISLYLPITGSLPEAAAATVKYREKGSHGWLQAHPLHRIRPHFSVTPAVGEVPDAFAWPIIDLQPGKTYEVEVTVSSGAIADTKKAAFATRTIPAPAPAATVTLASGTSAAEIQSALDKLKPGDVLQLQDGEYRVDNLQLNRSGTVSNPIYIRGESRAGVQLVDTSGKILQIGDASHVVVENMTLRGSHKDSHWDADSRGVFFRDDTPGQAGVTIRNLTMTGVDMGVVAPREVSGCLVYDNTLVGNNTWTPEFIQSNTGWNDDGIRLPGSGNAAFNNSLSGFGDALAYASHSDTGALTQTIGVHYYRNDLRNSVDDLAEIDDGHRNLTLYDNRSHNSMTFMSIDPLYGGPFVAARNTAVNVGRSPYKWTSPNTGHFIYNNTVVRTTGRNWVRGKKKSEVAWLQHRNGRQRVYGYRNNILIYRGVSNATLVLNNRGHQTLDFTHNSWYPDGLFAWGKHRYFNLMDAQRSVAETQPVFSGITVRHEFDNISEPNPWPVQVTLGTDYRSEITDTYTLELAAGTQPKNSGAVIPNITDGFSGSAPDRGGVIDGRQIPHYGDRSSRASAAH